MLSPKMQRTIRVNDAQLIMLSERAHYDHNYSGYLHKRSSDNTKWQLRWFILYQVNNYGLFCSKARIARQTVPHVQTVFSDRLILQICSLLHPCINPEESEPLEVRLIS
ncbi:unnamed protein product [Nesidiocoris tenuis]|uniref:PH domain-containing protein n=1 Tax=Nesidiocoris tenuis TaxID=355587 RepID=A0A6H5HUB7_9HEMI|nr:unnamed protein product [Nesidiocoris tenuis]